MKNWILDLQSLVMRGIGIRRSRQALDVRSDAIHDDLAARLDLLRVEVAERDRLAAERVEGLQRRLDDLGGQLSAQGQADTERGDTVQNMLRDLGAAIGELHRSTGQGDSVQLTLGELRAEMAALRADVARESELLDERLTGREDGRSLVARAS